MYTGLGRKWNLGFVYSIWLGRRQAVFVYSYALIIHHLQVSAMSGFLHQELAGENWRLQDLMSEVCYDRDGMNWFRRDFTWTYLPGVIMCSK